MVFNFFRLNSGFPEQLGKLVKGKYGVNKAVILSGLVLFCNAGTDENNLCAGVSLFDVRRVCLHWRKDVCKERHKRRKMLLNKEVDGVAAGGNDNVPSAVVHHFFIFLFDYRCADSGFLGAGKAELHQSFSHCVYTDVFIVCNEGRRKGGNHLRSRLQKDADLFGFADYLLCVLRTDNKAAAAKDTFVADYVRLIAGKADGFDRAVAQAFIAVFAVRFFKRKAVHSLNSFVLEEL